MAKRSASGKPKTGKKREPGAVGPGRPPVEHQFKPGNRAAVGHGRPRKLAELKELILETLAEEVSGVVDGQRISLTRAQHMIRTMLIKSPTDRIALLEYGFGKVPQQIDLNDITGQSDSELIDEFTKLLDAARARTSADDSGGTPAADN